MSWTNDLEEGCNLT